jgi:hypothetical protein
MAPDMILSALHDLRGAAQLQDGTVYFKAPDNVCIRYLLDQAGGVHNELAELLGQGQVPQAARR